MRTIRITQSLVGGQSRLNNAYAAPLGQVDAKTGAESERRDKRTKVSLALLRLMRDHRYILVDGSYQLSLHVNSSRLTEVAEKGERLALWLASLNSFRWLYLARMKPIFREPVNTRYPLHHTRLQAVQVHRKSLRSGLASKGGRTAWLTKSMCTI